ncbi:MAG TPA: benzoyl-CoA reductase subunit A [Thermoanaerobaculia bacterium]
MRVFVGIDLGSTTTKAVILDENEQVVGRGITNSRSNYDVAAAVVREEAFVRARFRMTEDRMRRDEVLGEICGSFLERLERHFRLQQYLEQLRRLRKSMLAASETPRHQDYVRALMMTVEDITERMAELAQQHFAEGAVRKSDFFRDLASSDFMHLAEDRSDPKGITFETLCSIFDAAILVVENTMDGDAFDKHIRPALMSVIREQHETIIYGNALSQAIEDVRSVELIETGTVGTGYGRQRLPFPKEQIRSEILCHGLGAHAMFPSTRTVLDIGGQDTKAIQVDADGIVTSFQMNDRCAAGCGRYLGYIADEMNLGLHELGPLAQKSQSRVKINSTCTVFAGAELRDRLALGQRREDILAGLHRAIMLRAMSLLARSGGIENEFTFTGGVARNPAAVAALTDLVRENYGERKINISHESIYTGALGAALFSHRAERKAVAA